MKLLLVVVSLIPLLTLSCREFGGHPQAKVTVRVINDDGNPVADATVVVLGSYGSLQAPIRKGQTDEDGLFTTKLPSDSTLSLQARAEGFHEISRMHYAFRGRQASDTGRWDPWNPTITIQLRGKTRRVSMFVKQVGETLPVLDTPIGFDLLQGDWVRPYGVGIVSDFVLEGSVTITNKTDYSGRLRISFTHADDGLIRVRQHYGNSYGLWLPGIAPKTGYTNEMEFISRTSWPVDSHVRSDWENFDTDDNYYFRVRSSRDLSAGTVSGLYGKIYWGIFFHPQPAGLYGAQKPLKTQGVVRFLYYLNPDGTRHTEFDVRQNLNPDPGAFAPKP